MTDSNSASGTLTRTGKQSDTPHPHYFSSFQNYCSGPKSKTTTTTTTSTSTKDFLPIPEKFKIKDNKILASINGTVIERLRDLTQYTSVLPFEFFEQDQMPEGARYLVDRMMFKMMNETRVINWMPSLRKLYPVRTSGNGNCLLHAVLIAMAGVHDFNLNLRDRLLQFMDKNKEVLKSSWKNERLKTDKIYGIQSEDSKLDSEWEELCDLVRYENSDDGQATSNLQFLEGVHIFSISNMLGRPIIILSEEVVRNKHGEAISYNDLFGIYLPVLMRPEDCILTPIVLAYDQSHFCPLQASDKKTGSTSDNYLPLYQSMDHIQDQTLLPIRFLGNDSSSEQTNKLLKTFLRLKTLSFYPDAKSPPVSIQCAELDSKHLSEEHNYFLVYYDYLVDFFETQKKQKQQREEEDRRRQQDYYSNDLSYDTNQRSLKKADPLSSSPPPSYSSAIFQRTNDTKINSLHERRSSYDKALANENMYGSYSDNNRPLHQYSTSQNFSQLTDRRPLSNDNNKQYSSSRSDWESNNDDYTSGIKSTNNSKLRQESVRQMPSTYVPIPIHFENSNPASNLIDFEQRTDKIRPCLICKLNFNDVLSTKICPECDYNMKHSIRSTTGYNITRPTPSINTYPKRSQHSDFLIPLPRSSKAPNKLHCPYCQNINIINYGPNISDYTCSVCRNTIYR